MFSEVFVTHKKFDIKAHSPFFYYRSPILLYHKKTKTATLLFQNFGFFGGEKGVFARRIYLLPAPEEQTLRSTVAVCEPCVLQRRVLASQTLRNKNTIPIRDGMEKGGFARRIYLLHAP